MAKFFLIGEKGDAGMWLVDVEGNSVQRIEEGDVAGDLRSAGDDTIMRGIDLAVASESRSGLSAHNRLQVAY
jgi:hypothetical protein